MTQLANLFRAANKRADAKIHCVDQQFCAKRKATFFEKISEFKSDKRGNVAILFAITVIPMLGLVGAAIDYSNAIRLKQKIASTIDAAALAAGSAVDLTIEDRKALAEEFIDANFTTLVSGTVGTPSVTISDSTINIKLAGSMPTTFLAVMGLQSVDVSASTEVTVKDTKMEVALVLDTTGSMGGSKISTLRSATKDLIDTLYAQDGSKDNIKTGIVPFNNMVNVGKAYESAPWLKVDIAPKCTKKGKGKKKKTTCVTPAWDGCVKPRDGSKHVNDAIASSSDPILGDECSYSVKELMPLTNSKSLLKAKADSLGASGTTYIPMGLAWGWRILSKSEPFTEGASYSDDDWQKAMILMTDGQNTVSYSNTGASANANTTTLCNNIKGAGITVYTVAFQISDTTTKNMLQSCASKNSYYYDASNNAALTAAFSSIAQQLSQLRLSK